MWEQTLAVFLVLGLLAGSLWLLRRKGLAGMKFGLAKGFGGARRLEALERLMLTPQHSLHLVRVDDRLLLVGVSPQNCALVDSLGVASKTLSNQTAWTAGPEGAGR